MNNFISKDSGLLGSAFDADSDGIEENIMFINMMKSKILKILINFLM